MKIYRVYFNSKADAPNSWSVDEGTVETEVLVASVELLHVDLTSRLNFNADNVHEPKAWFEVAGTLHLLANHAVITGPIERHKPVDRAAERRLELHGK